MKSYLVLTAPEGSDLDHDKTKFIHDGFSWLALLFGPLWLLANRAFLAGFITLSISILLATLGMFETLSFGASTASLALNLFIALEGREWKANAFERRGWQLRSVIVASDIDVAEEIFFTGIEETSPLKAFEISSERNGQTAHSGIGLMDSYSAK